MTVRLRSLVYGLSLSTAFAIWMIAIRAPLWLDETVSMYLIQGGLKGMASRHAWPDSPTYSYLLWLWTALVGRSEILLRLSSLLPMLAAVYLLYRAARELFDREAALFAAIAFSLHSIIVFAAIDIRPYAFAALAVNASILALVHLRHSTSRRLAAAFGFAAACIVQFQLLFSVILPALLICFMAARLDDCRALWRQLAVALPVFAIACLPAIPRLQYIAKTSGTHVFAENPTLLELGSTFTLRGLAGILVCAALLAATRKRLDLQLKNEGWTILLCLTLALVPIFTLYGLSADTTVHVFVPRYRLVAVPGITLCWAWLFNRITSEQLRVLACVAMVAATAYIHLSTPFLRQHQYSWKYAIAFLERNASADGAPVLMCSDIPEADYMPMPAAAATLDSGILPPLSYYPLSVPVTPLPRALNDEAKRNGMQFLQQQAARHQRFLATAFAQSFDTLDWLAKEGAGQFYVWPLGQFDGVRVLEFIPR